MAKTETKIDELKINYLTEAQYQTALSNGEINENEIYMTPDSGATIPTKTSDLTNDSGFLTSVPTAGNGSLGVVKTTSSVSSTSGLTACPIISGVVYYKDTNTTYTAGTGLTLSGTQFKHSNSVTAATAQGDSNKTLTFGGTFTIPTISYDAQGHITGKGTTTMTMPANPNSDTKNTAGSTNTSSKIYLVGATSQAANPQTYSHDTAYVGTDGCLYSNSTKVSVEGHTHSYLPLSGGTLTGALTANSGITTTSLSSTGDIWVSASSGEKHIGFKNGKSQIYMFSRPTSDSTDVVWGIYDNTYKNMMEYYANKYLAINPKTYFLSDVLMKNNNLIRGLNTSGNEYTMLTLSNSNTVNLGNTSLVTRLYGSSVYLNGTSTAVTSDERAKKDFGTLDRFDNFFMDLKPVEYKYLTGTSDRFHVGFKAQEVKKALESNGLTTQDFAGYVEEDIDKDYYMETLGYVPFEGKEAGLRYSEFIGLNTYKIQKCIKKIDAQDEIIKKQGERITELEDRIKILEAKS